MYFFQTEFLGNRFCVWLLRMFPATEAQDDKLQTCRQFALLYAFLFPSLGSRPPIQLPPSTESCARRGWNSSFVFSNTHTSTWDRWQNLSILRHDAVSIGFTPINKASYNGFDHISSAVRTPRRANAGSTPHSVKPLDTSLNSHDRFFSESLQFSFHNFIP
jgi:hypothetical protein